MSTEEYDFSKEFKQVYMSYQRPSPASISEQMNIQLQSYPALGQVTPVENREIKFTTVLEIALSCVQKNWEVALWFSLDGADWTTKSSTPIVDDARPQTLQALPTNTSQFYFTCSLCISQSVQFTLKFRREAGETWKWARDEVGLEDGLVVVTSSLPDSGALHKLLPDLNDAWTVSQIKIQSSSSDLWSLEKPMRSVNGNFSVVEDAIIGIPWGSYLRWFALVRIWSPWLAPRQGKSKFVLDKDAIICSFISADGDNLVFLALSGLGNLSTTFCNTEQGGISVHARNDGNDEGKMMILVSRGCDFEQAVATVMHHARHLLKQTSMAAEELLEEAPLQSEREKMGLEWKENWYDGLGYCTWNALGQHLTEEKVLDAMKKLTEHEVNVTSLIIDDNWQSIDYKGKSPFQYSWIEFEAERKAFPRGLKGLVSQIRKQNPRIQHIAVWHALLGYWGGISPGGKIDQSYETIEVICDGSKRRNLPLGGPMTVVAERDVEGFYDDFYRFLVEAGIDGVKTDAQFIIDTWNSASVRRKLVNKYLDTWSETSFRHFGIKAISCMSQIPQALFHSQMPKRRPPLVVRNSDDFFPEVPVSHTWHVWANAYNSILTQFLNVLPDWDMFQTVHDYSAFHAAARCVSGGPIYLTDKPGEHNMQLIGQMTGITANGKTVVLRPSAVGRSMNPYVGFDDNILLKVGSSHATQKPGASILGVFNISGRALTELLPLSCFPGIALSMKYVIRAHTTGKVSIPTRAGQVGELLTVSLDTRGYDILCAFPLTAFTCRKYGDGWLCNLGLLGKMTGCAAIVAESISQSDQGTVMLEVRLKALGVLGIFISAPAAEAVVQDLEAVLNGQPVPRHLVKLSREDDCVIEVDAASAWREMSTASQR